MSAHLSLLLDECSVYCSFEEAESFLCPTTSRTLQLTVLNILQDCIITLELDRSLAIVQDC